MVKRRLVWRAMSASRFSVCHPIKATSLLHRFPQPVTSCRGSQARHAHCRHLRYVALSAREKEPDVTAGLAGGNTMIRFCHSLAGVAAVLAPLVFGVAAARAQTAYPDRPVKIIVPIGPGGSYDLVGRHLADALSKRTGQAFFVENKPGAGTVVGTQVAAQSEPDGYTLLVGGLSNMAFNSALYSKLAYDPLKDFVPVALVYRFGYVMVGRKDLPQTMLP